MTTYYVSTTGSDSNNGLSAAAPFKTLGKVVTVEAAGDVVYVAPGWYREALTLTASGTAGNLITWIADIQGTMTLSTPGRVVVTPRTLSAGEAVVSLLPTLDIKDKKFRRFEYIIFLGGYSHTISAAGTVAATYEQVQFHGCSILCNRVVAAATAYAVYVLFNEGGTPATSGLKFTHCTISGAMVMSYKSNTSAEYNLKIVFDRCIIYGGAYNVGALYYSRSGSATNPNYTAFGFTFQNCYILLTGYGFDLSASNLQAGSTVNYVQNCIIQAPTTMMVWGVYQQDAKLVFRNCSVITGGDGNNYASLQNFSSSYDLFLEGFHDHAIAKLLADIGIRTNLFARIEPPDVIAPFNPPVDETNITLSSDLYGNNNNFSVKTFKFAGTINDPNGYWGNDANLADAGKYSTYAYSASQGSETTGYLEIVGTGSLGAYDPGTIQNVYVRIYTSGDSSNNISTAYKIYTQGRAETLASGTITIPMYNDIYNDPLIVRDVLLATPTGGWTTDKITNLVARFWKSSAPYASSKLHEIEVLIQGTTAVRHYIGPVNPVTQTQAVAPQRAMTSTKTLWGPASIGMIASTSSPLTDGYLSTATNKVGDIITLPYSGIIDKVCFYVSGKGGTPPIYRVAIMTVGSDGNPTTTPYGGCTYGEYTHSSTGLKWITLGNPATATLGDTVAVVIYPGDVAPDGSNYITVAYGGIATPGRSGTFAFGGWTLNAASTAVAVHYTSGQIYGYALTSNSIVQSVRSDTTPDEIGDKFTLPSTATCFGGRFLADGWGWGGSCTFELVLYDSANNVVAKGTVSDKDYVAKDLYVDIYWSPVVLTAGAIYRLIVKPTTGTGGEIRIFRFQMYDQNAMYMWPCGNTWQGTSRVDGGPWSDVATDMYYMALWLSEMSYSEVRMASIMEGFPLNAEIIGTGRAELNAVNGRMVLEFDADSDETADWTFIAPQSALGSSLTMFVFYAMASATSGTVVFQAQVEAISPGDTVDLDAATNFDTANSGSATVPGTAGYMSTVSIVLDNRASMAEGDLVRVRLNRDANSGSDTATGDAYVYAVEIRNT